MVRQRKMSYEEKQNRAEYWNIFSKREWSDI